MHGIMETVSPPTEKMSSNFTTNIIEFLENARNNEIDLLPIAKSNRGEVSLPSFSMPRSPSSQTQRFPKLPNHFYIDSRTH